MGYKQNKGPENMKIKTELAATTYHLETELLQVTAERDFALKGWVALWNQFESVGLCTTKITSEQMLEKIRGKLGTQ